MSEAARDRNRAETLCVSFLLGLSEVSEHGDECVLDLAVEVLTSQGSPGIVRACCKVLTSWLAPCHRSPQGGRKHPQSLQILESLQQDVQMAIRHIAILLVDSSVECQPDGFLLLSHSVLHMPVRHEWKKRKLAMLLAVRPTCLWKE